MVNSGQGSSSDLKGTKRDFSTAILERKKAANRLIVDEPINDDNLMAAMNPETVEKQQLFRGDTILLKNNTNLENFDENKIEDEASSLPTTQQSQFEASSSSKFKKGKGCDSHDDINKLSIAIESIANAIIQSTNAMVQALNTCFVNPNPTKDCDVWAMLTDLGISQPFLMEAYIFLIKDPKMLEGLIRCPNEHRKSLLLTMMGYGAMGLRS